MNFSVSGQTSEWTRLHCVLGLCLSFNVPGRNTFNVVRAKICHFHATRNKNCNASFWNKNNLSQNKLCSVYFIIVMFILWRLNLVIYTYTIHPSASTASLFTLKLDVHRVCSFEANVISRTDKIWAVCREQNSFKQIVDKTFWIWTGSFASLN